MKVFRISIGLVMVTAVSTQFFTFRQTPVNFFSYFTVLSSLLVAFAFITSALKILEQKQADMLRGAATLYILITSLGFIFLLGGKNEEFVAWVNIVLHYIAPIVMLSDWLLIPSAKISFRKSFVWILFLLLYLVYSLFRGSVISWYPYSFLNAPVIGYDGVLKYVGILTTGALVICWFLIKLSGRNETVK